MKKLKMKMDWRTKKRNGNGSIRDNKDGSYTARIQWIDVDGKRKEVTRKTVNRREAQRAISQISDDLQNHGGHSIQAEKMRFSDLAERFEKTKLVPAIYDGDGKVVLGLRSLAPVKSALKPLIQHFGRRITRDIRSSDLERYKTERLNTPVIREINVKVPIENGGRKKVEVRKETVSKKRAIATVNRELQLLRHIFRFAKSDKLILSSPFDDHSIISAAAETERNRVLSLEEEARLMAACKNERAHLKSLIITALQTAMRRGELFKLKWSDVNFGERIITVQASNTKTETKRIIAMTRRVEEELAQLWEVSPKYTSELVFGITSTIKRSWATACKLAGIDNLRFHDLRHTATTRFVRAGVPLSEAMKITGHSQIKTFQRYMNLTNESVTASARLLDVYLDSHTVPTIDGTSLEMVH